uniref:Uncharacterized protein n=1 Tax=Pristionchus pacificus TaxID=54126 RepID=A0A2A6C6U5_PRIPA|eukprot:PDM73773.1 hypothetical protein PRIPAC_41129 [Pristionchus pacificus]
MSDNGQEKAENSERRGANSKFRDQRSKIAPPAICWIWAAEGAPGGIGMPAAPAATTGGP